MDHFAAAIAARREMVDSAADDNHIATVIVTKCGAPATYVSPSDHYSLLATIEDGFGFARLRKAKEAAPLTQLARRRCG